jgi:hypothetical protein
MRPKLQKQSDLKLAGRIIPQGISSLVENMDVKKLPWGISTSVEAYISSLTRFPPQKT